MVHKDFGNIIFRGSVSFCGAKMEIQFFFLHDSDIITISKNILPHFPLLKHIVVVEDTSFGFMLSEIELVSKITVTQAICTGRISI